MRVLVTAIAQPVGISGVQRHALNLVRCLLHRNEIIVVHLILAPWQLHLPALAGLEPGERLRIEVATVKRGSFSRNLWHLRDLPVLALRLQADLVHLTYPVPFRSAAMPCPVVMTLHDLYPFEIPDNFKFPQVIVNRWILRIALRQADAVSCVSRTTLRQLQASGMGRASLRGVIPNCVEPGPACSERAPVESLNNEPFLLSVAQHRRNKNLDLLLHSFSRLRTSGQLSRSSWLAIVGMQGPETMKLHALVRELQLVEHVRFLDELNEAELQWCYQHCAVVVTPSLTEGFGLPVAEARLAGCRIVCSDIPAFRELAGPETQLVALQGNIEQGICDAIAGAIAQTKPLPVRLPELAMDAIADKYVDLYRTVLAQQPESIRNVPASSHVMERQIP